VARPDEEQKMKTVKIEAIFGPPGTGKSRTLIELAEGKKVLMLSYTKAGALELASRVNDNSQIRASTIHALVFEILNLSRASVVNNKKLIEFGKVTGIPFKGSEFGVDEIQEGDEYISVLSFAKNRIVPINDAYDHFGQPGTRNGFLAFERSYENWKSTFGFVDFDDMLIRCLAIEKFPHHASVFLDEAQDCSPLQWRVFNKITHDSDEVIIAGDDDQAIYEWNGADPHGMADFAGKNNAKVRILDQSYRVPKQVHDLAHETALFNIKRRVHKNFNPCRHPGEIIRFGGFDDVSLSSLYELGGGMLLARDRWHLEDMKKALNRDMIPYSVMGGHSPWTSKIADELRAGRHPDIPIWWSDFYKQADLSLPINITLSTIHQAKGREHHRVVVDLGLPARTLAAMYNNRDAELRVLYVALTRTSHELVLCGENPLLT
jgi:superfamily I DNA/RNA helicase